MTPRVLGVEVAPEAGRAQGLIVPSGPQQFGRQIQAVGQRVELLFVDSSHDRDDTVREVEAWRGALVPGAIVALDDYDHPDYPGVREAVTELGLRGEQAGTLFVARAG